MYTFNRRGLLYVAAGSSAAIALAACSSGAPPTTTGTGSASGSTNANRQISQDAYDAVIKGGPVADDATVSASPWATKIKGAGFIKRGGTTTGAIFAVSVTPSGAAQAAGARASNAAKRAVWAPCPPTAAACCHCRRRAAARRSSRRAVRAPCRARPAG